MCGIIGYTGSDQALPVLMRGLLRLEYRGYDSAGIAVSGECGVQVIKTAGSVKCLKEKLGGTAVIGHCGIGHTRWATHGKADEKNAHPHASRANRVTAVHNGIIENHAEIAEELAGRGYVFRSRTDTEAAVLLLDWLYEKYRMEDMAPQKRALAAIRDMAGRLRGSYALGILFGDQPGTIYAVCQNSPLVIGAADRTVKGQLLASDVTAMLGLADRVAYLRDGNVACLTQDGAQLFDAQGNAVGIAYEPAAWPDQAADKTGYAHYMRKEIAQQPQAVRDTLLPRIRTEGEMRRVDLLRDGIDGEALARVSRVYLIGCGSAYHAACVGKTVIRQLAGIPCEAELASEFRYGDTVWEEHALAVIISQSGETADSLAALRRIRRRGIRTLAVVNAAGSSMTREADMVLLTHAGPEISVATTKAYASQLAALYLLAIRLASQRGAIDQARETALIRALMELPERMERCISGEADVMALAGEIAQKQNVFFMGRGLDYAAAMEGSLKLKEVSYIHAEAYAAGELKHGTISLIEPGVPVIVIATQQALLDKTLANAQEVRCRGAQVVLIVPEGFRVPEDQADCVIYIPGTEPLFMASLSAVPMQMLAYHVSCAKGIDVDRPRNLAKSVTVE